jgi:hypothetical protein
MTDKPPSICLISFPHKFAGAREKALRPNEVPDMSEEKTCPCGKPLHYIDPHHQEVVERQIAELGECTTITIAETGRRFRVPRHLIALHGVTGRDLPELVGRFGIEEVA